MIRTLFVTKRERTVLIALGLFLVTLPISYGLSSVSAIIIGCLFVLDTPQRIKQKTTQLFKNKFFLILLCFFVIQLIGTLYSENTKQAIRGVRILFPFVALPMTILTERLDKQKGLKLVSFFKYYMFFGLLAAFIFQWISYGNLLSFEHDAFAILEINPFYFSAFIYIAILDALFTLIKQQFKGIKEYIFIAFFSFSLLLLGARISILILVFCFVLFVFKLLPNISFLKKATISLSIIGALFVIAYQIPQVKKKVDITVRTMDFDFKTILTKNQISITRNTVEYRVLINYCSLQVLKTNILGVGIGDYREALIEQYEKLNFRAGKTKKFNSHNQYMEEFVKQGIIGGAIFIILILYILKKGAIHKSYFYYVAIYIALVCLVESFFYRQHGVMFAAFFLPLFYNIEILHER